MKVMGNTATDLSGRSITAFEKTIWEIVYWDAELEMKKCMRQGWLDCLS